MGKGDVPALLLGRGGKHPSRAKGSIHVLHLLLLLPIQDRGHSHHSLATEGRRLFEVGGWVGAWVGGWVSYGSILSLEVS